MANNYLKLRCKCGNDNGGITILWYSPGSWQAHEDGSDALNAFLEEHVHSYAYAGQDQWFIEYWNAPAAWEEPVITYP